MATKQEPIGLHARRLAENRDNPREMVFVKHWHREHEGNRDLLGELFLVPCDRTDPNVLPWSLLDTFGPKCAPLEAPTERDRIVVETVIQWLGSNVGICFLSEALKSAGYRLTVE